MLFYFSNRISAFDIIFDEQVPYKGEILCRFAKFWFDFLKTPNHMKKIVEKNKMIVERLDMIPIEFVVRGFFYGSLVDRFKSGHAYDIVHPLKPGQ